MSLLNLTGGVVSLGLLFIWMFGSMGVYDTYLASVAQWEIGIVLTVFWLILALLILAINRLT